MSEFNINVDGGTSVKLKTAGKYCDRDIVVNAIGSTGGEAKPEQEKTVSITENGTTVVTPDDGKVLSKVNINVNVASDGGTTELPTGYYRTDYIQFTSEQVIDTGVIFNKNTKLEVVFTREKSSQHYLLGVSSSDNTASVTAYLGGNWRFGNKAYTKSPLTNENMIYTAILDATQITITGSQTALTGVNEFETIGSLLVGTCRSNSGAVASPTYTGKIFFLMIWQDEELVLRLVPVVSADGEYRFFDMVSKTFFDSITDTPLKGGIL